MPVGIVVDVPDVSVCCSFNLKGVSLNDEF
jgi:hypothetical protein